VKTVNIRYLPIILNNRVELEPVRFTFLQGTRFVICRLNNNGNPQERHDCVLNVAKFIIIQFFKLHKLFREFQVLNFHVKIGIRFFPLYLIYYDVYAYPILEVFFFYDHRSLMPLQLLFVHKSTQLFNVPVLSLTYKTMFA